MDITKNTLFEQTFGYPSLEIIPNLSLIRYLPSYLYQSYGK